MQDAYRLTKTTLLTLLAVGMSQMSASAQDSASNVESANPMIGTATWMFMRPGTAASAAMATPIPGPPFHLEWSN